MKANKRRAKKKNGRIDYYHGIWGIFLLAHNPWDSCTKLHCHVSCPFCIGFTRCTNFPFHWSIFIFYLLLFNEKKRKKCLNMPKSTKYLKHVSRMIGHEQGYYFLSNKKGFMTNFFKGLVLSNGPIEDKIGLNAIKQI